MQPQVELKVANSSHFSLSVTHSTTQDLNILGRLGRGATSYVFKVSLNKPIEPTGSARSTYAMKVIDKNNPRYQQISEALTHQINIHSKLDHPHIVKLNGHIEDRQNHYILMEYCRDGEATQLLGKQLSESTLRLISYQVALGLSYLHRQNIIHGDVKPTNILVSDGLFLGKKLCDFGFSTKLTSKEGRKSRACGTPVFMAPEIVSRQPYGLEVDCWSFGMCLLLWYKGTHPYKAKNEQELMREIKKCNIEYPDSMPMELKQLLQGILVAEPQKRLTIEQILQHPFYSDHKRQLEMEYRKLMTRESPVKATNTKQRRQRLLDSTSLNKDHDATLKKVKSSGELKIQQLLSRKEELERTLKRNTSGQKKPSLDSTKRFNAKDLKPQIFQVGKAKASILQDGSFEIDLDGVRMVISSDGEYIKVYDNREVHVFFRDQLPSNYLKLYQQAVKLVSHLRQNTHVLLWKVEQSPEGLFEMHSNRRDFRAVIGSYEIRHNTLEYLVSVRREGSSQRRLHPIEYVCRNSDSLQKALRLFLRKEKQFLKGK